MTCPSSRIRPLARLAFAAALVTAMVSCGGKKAPEERAFLPAQEVYRLAVDALAHKRLVRARQLFERVRLTQDSDRELEPLVRLGLADVAFYRGDDLSLIEARSKYLDFVTLYADHALAPYAQFQAGICSFLQVRDPSRDQTQTRTAIQDFREVPRRYPASPYAYAADRMAAEAEAFLSQHDFLVGKFYFRRKALPAAVNRFQQSLEKLKVEEGRDRLFYYLGQALILAERVEEGRVYLDRLVREFPESPFAAPARKLLRAPLADGDPSPEGP